MNTYRALYIRGNKQFKTYILAKDTISAINLLFDSAYRDARAYNHHQLISISLLKKGK